MSTIAFDALADAAGRDLGRTEWTVIDQARVNDFADVTEDHQWIHVDPVRASAGPYGSTIAHGYLTLSYAGARLSELLDVPDCTSIINYGLDRARFPAPLKSGTRIRTHGVISDVESVPQGFQVSVRITAEAEDSDRPVCVADVKVRVLKVPTGSE
ncbi:MaoC family dehydratase [Mycolicibacterium anyangense]|uniref:MaoC family dehydratase n=1 Tax=Mycolicibacterium anyangense TaxID=1431246 RepID=A0A6N4WF73_9MYCO|nr:MaoC family dehydratase [Mycolicibacterium anyangense]BBZ78582.1 MaoC family dehydratase [Mycolicibacterium anyangense]